MFFYPKPESPAEKELTQAEKQLHMIDLSHQINNYIQTQVDICHQRVWITYRIKHVLPVFRYPSSHPLLVFSCTVADFNPQPVLHAKKE